MSKSSLKERISDWADDSPLVQVPAGFVAFVAMTGYGLVSGLAEGIKWQFDSATKPLKDFEPRFSPQQRELKWSLDVMGDNRIDKLVDRLSLTDIPHVDKKAQIWALSQSYAGIKNLPQQEQLVKYGLNDRTLLHIARGIDLAADRALRELSQEVPHDVAQQKTEGFIQGSIDSLGLKAASKDEILKDREFFLVACVESALESCSSFDRGNPETKGKLAQVIFDWLIKDVQPEVPTIFGNLRAPAFVPARHSRPETFNAQPA